MKAASHPGSKPRKAPPRWARFDDERLLDLRLCDLGLTLRRSPVQPRLQRLFRELGARGLRFRPHVWLAADWFSPDGVPGFAVPFYLAHPRLRRLERRMSGIVEGSNANWQMRILRHEAGHAFDSAYRLRRRARWRELFGNATRPYCARYHARPASRSHVQHLGEWYAQAHPTEDFAETFAVWLQPRSTWRRRYAGWPARRKLEFVDSVAAEVGRRPHPVRNRDCIEPLAECTVTLREHYRRKRAVRLRWRRALADAHLRRLFAAAGAATAGRRTAATLLRSLRPQLRAALVRRAGADRYAAQQIVRLAIERCGQLDLRLRSDRVASRERLLATLVRVARAYLASGAVGLWL
jgi:hypothetical protein